MIEIMVFLALAIIFIVPPFLIKEPAVSPYELELDRHRMRRDRRGTN